MFRILVAEDDHAICTLITTKLKQENYTIYTAEMGKSPVRHGEAPSGFINFRHYDASDGRVFPSKGAARNSIPCRF